MTIRVLLVDDDPGVRTVLRVALRARGEFTVVGEAATAVEATELARRLRPDVVVLDLGLPDLAARDLLGQVRRASATSRIVIFSGMDAEREWFEQRADGYVVKARDVDQLVDLLVAVANSPHDETFVELAHDAVAPSEARSIVRDVLAHWGYRDLVDDAALVVSELVTNAVRHAASASVVVVHRTEGGIRVEVRDQGAGALAPGESGPADEGGRGLMIVSALATAWGVDDQQQSKSVWVELTSTRGEDR